MRKRNQGMALIVVLVLISILGLFTGLVAGQQGFSGLGTGAGGDSEQAYFIAMGALNRGLSELRNDSQWPGVSDAKFPGSTTALFDVAVIKNETASPLETPVGVDLPPGFSLVIATGKLGDSYSTVAGLLGVESSVGSGYAAVSTWYTRLQGGTVDAFTTDTSFKSSDLQTVENKAQLASINDKVKMYAKWISGVHVPTQVDGTIASDRLDGDNSTPDPDVYDIDAVSTFGGETQTTDPPQLDDLPAMSFLGGQWRDANSGSLTITPGHYDGLSASNDGEIVLEPGDYYFASDFRLTGGAKVRTNGPVRLFIQNELMVKQNAVLNFEGDPRDCEIYVKSTGDTVNVWGQGVVMGRVRAPEATLHVSGEIFGDVQGKMIEVYGEDGGVGAIHYFADLAPAGTGQTEESLTYRSVWVVGARQVSMGIIEEPQ